MNGREEGMSDYLEHRNDLSDPDFVTVFDELSFWSSRFGHLLVQHVPLGPKRRILDLACGLGFPLFELAHVSGPSCRLVGVDVWERGLARAAWKRAVYGLANVALAQADGAALPFAPATFDLIVSNLGINNFARPAAILAECYRVARPQARLVLTTNVVGHMREFYEVFRATLIAQGKAAYLDALRANENHRGTRDSISALIEGAGFRVGKVIEDQFTMRFVDGSALLRHRLVKVGFLDGWRGVLPPEEAVPVFAAVEAQLNARAAEAGELRMTVPMLYIEGEKADAG
jgi:ubiquinone/menaquinone biosynthesis C-methylase UbiE